MLTKYVVGANTNPPKNPTNPPKKGKVMPTNIVRAAQKMQNKYNTEETEMQMLICTAENMEVYSSNNEKKKVLSITNVNGAPDQAET